MAAAVTAPCNNFNDPPMVGVEVEVEGSNGDLEVSSSDNDDDYGADSCGD